MSKKFLAAALLPTAAFAQQLTIPVNPTMVVTATRVAQPASSVLAPVNVVTRDEIDRLQAQTVTDVVKTLPGVEVVSNGGRGQMSSLRVRGGTSSQTLVLVDGVRSASLTAGMTELNNLPLNQVERIEYIRGPRATIYGSDAIGGVINIITRPDKGTNQHKFNIGAGSHQLRQAAFSSASQVGEAGQLKVAGGFDDEEGYNVHPLPGINDGDRHGHQGYNAMLDYQQALGSNWDLFGTTRWFRNVAQYAGSDANYTPHRAETWTENQSYQLGSRYHDDRYLSELRGAFSRQDAYDYLDNSGRDQANNRGYTRQYSLNWVNSLKLNELWMLGGGADWQRDMLDDRSRSSGSPYPAGAKERDNTGVYALAQFDNQTWQGELSGRSDDNEQYGRHNTWQTGAGWRFAEDYRLSARYGTGFRAPSFNDLYFPRSGNPNLKPEESKSSELMLDGQTAGVEWRATGYRNDFEQMIQWAPNSQGMWTPQNVGKARIEGVELEGEFDTGWLSHRVSAEYKDPKDKVTDKQLQRVSRKGAKWITQAQWQQFDGSLSWIYQGERYDDVANTTKLGGYSLWNLVVGYKVTPALKVSGKINNLLDKHYQTSVGYPADERAYYVTMDYSL
ncbi:TonB-dependent receptor [Aeromonas veronii]|uniref:TonB-dependent receptor domain-containing protein n=1 Tax=Aeromonas veronii TaxID=654 RepID=UPI00111AAEFD|nr:TonB-dependent receptor [Aeromonas veronii]MCX0424300.1 TonB-dependent receptor [Aeromonas veronii]TNI72602.1 TonB-dependent receptor [Aeromonas veronii]WIJ43410.1 TonB-dependent receptor [Aeromonas veronii]